MNQQNKTTSFIDELTRSKPASILMTRVAPNEGSVKLVSQTL